MRFVLEIRHLKGIDSLTAAAYGRRANNNLEFYMFLPIALPTVALVTLFRCECDKDLKGQRLLPQGSAALSRKIICCTPRLWCTTNYQCCSRGLARNNHQWVSKYNVCRACGHEDTWCIMCRHFMMPAMSSSVILFCRKGEACHTAKGRNALPLDLVRRFPLNCCTHSWRPPLLGADLEHKNGLPFSVKPSHGQG